MQTVHLEKIITLKLFFFFLLNPTTGIWHFSGTRVRNQAQHFNGCNNCSGGSNMASAKLAVAVSQFEVIFSAVPTWLSLCCSAHPLTDGYSRWLQNHVQLQLPVIMTCHIHQPLLGRDTLVHICCFKRAPCEVTLWLFTILHWKNRAVLLALFYLPHNSALGYVVTTHCQHISVKQILVLLLCTLLLNL